jgi:hypothetical protein
MGMCLLTNLPNSDRCFELKTEHGFGRDPYGFAPRERLGGGSRAGSRESAYRRPFTTPGYGADDAAECGAATGEYPCPLIGPDAFFALFHKVGGFKAVQPPLDRYRAHVYSKIGSALQFALAGRGSHHQRCIRAAWYREASFGIEDILGNNA